MHLKLVIVLALCLSASASAIAIGNCADVKSEVFKCIGLQLVDRFIERDILQVPFLPGWRFVRTMSASNTTPPRADRQSDFKDALIARALKFLRTHALQIPLPKNITSEARRRHHHRHRNDMMGLLLFGSMAMAVIAIPMGFQFLAVLGGKALMLAKLALILTSIQGLKKIATSNLNYGLYHAPAHSTRHHWLYDRRWQPSQTQLEPNGGLFDGGGFDTPPESHLALDPSTRSRIIMPRIELHRPHHNE